MPVPVFFTSSNGLYLPPLPSQWEVPTHPITFPFREFTCKPEDPVHCRGWHEAFQPKISLTWLAFFIWFLLTFYTLYFKLYFLHNTFQLSCFDFYSPPFHCGHSPPLKTQHYTQNQSTQKLLKALHLLLSSVERKKACKIKKGLRDLRIRNVSWQISWKIWVDRASSFEQGGGEVGATLTSV